MPSPPPAWYADPDDPARVRWWDGESWTDWVRDHPTGASTPPPLSPRTAPPDESLAPSSSLPSTATTAEDVMGSSAAVPAEWIGPVAPTAPPTAQEVWSPGFSDSSLSSVVANAGWSSGPTEMHTTPAPEPVWPGAGGQGFSGTESESVWPGAGRQGFSGAESEPVWPAAGGQGFSGAESEPVWPAAGAVDRRQVEHSPLPPKLLARLVDDPQVVPDPAPAPAPEPATESAPAALGAVMSAPTPLITDEHPRPVRPSSAPAHEISIGATLLPPLEPPSPPVDASESVGQDSSSRRGVLRAVLVTAVLVATSVLGFALYSRGTFDGLIGRTGRQPSSDAVTVYEGTGYSFEVANAWQREEPLGDVDFAFAAPSGDIAQVIVASDESVAAADLSNPSTRTAAFDTIIRVVQAVNPGAKVLAREPIDVAGAPGEKLTMAGTQPYTGKSFQSTVYLFVHGSEFFSVGLVSSESGADASVTAAFDRIVESFRFD